MDIKQCPNCQKLFDQDKRVSKQLPCGCASCLKCLKYVYQYYKKVECSKHQQVYSENPEEFKIYQAQEPILQNLVQHQEKFIDQEMINEQLRCLQDQYVQAQNYRNMIIKVMQDSSQFFKHIQSLSSQEILKTQIEQFSQNNEGIKNLLKRLSEFQVVNEVQQQQALGVGQQDPNLRQNHQGQLQQQFQQILLEIDELKKNQSQWMDVQSLRVNVQRCMFGMFAFLNENSKGQLLTDKEAECLVQKYFEQNKLQNSRIQVQNSVVQQKSQLQSQNIDSQLIQESQNIGQQQQNQVIDEQQGQDIRQVNQFLVQFFNQIKEENVSIQQLEDSPLNKSGLIDQMQILYQLPQVTDQQICLKLSQIIQLCKSQQGVSQAATNAITLLNYMNFAFTNQNFQSLDLTKSDLSDTTFTNCNFANSNLTLANLRNTKFINCDFTSSNLTSIITEHPHIFTYNTSYVWSVAISSDSEFIVSGSNDKMVRLWDIKTGTCKTMSGHTRSVTSIAISNNSEFIVSGSDDKTVRLWDVKTGICKTMSGHTNSVYAVAISRNSEFIVSGSDDKTVRLWNVKTGISQIMSGHTSSVTSIAISSDSEFFVSGSADKTVRLWDVKTGTSQTMNDHTDRVTSIAISSDSEFIVSGSDDKTVRLWLVRTLVCIKVILGHSFHVYSVLFSVDNKYIISGS